ncbi:MAG: hypothetical protein Aurels2KO_34510 [Aureliella sp.]
MGKEQASTEQKKRQAESAQETENTVNEKARSMVITVVDEKTNPIEGVDVYVTGIDYERRGGNGNLPRIHYPTDASGESRIKFREGTLLLQVLTRGEGYVPQYIRLNEREQPLPTEYTFYFEKGERLAGKIVDSSGKPIHGATVQVKTSSEVALNSRSNQASPPAHCSGWLAEDELSVTTNSQGEWEIDNAPSVGRNPKLQFELLIDHSEFAGDRQWGAYQKKQDITSEQLRNGTATFVMERGVILKGTVTGPNDEPVTEGLVTWVSNPYFATGVNEALIQPDGTFQLPNLEPGKYPITVIAPGYAPDQREIELSYGSTDCNFVLEAGNPIKLELVDTSGNPVPNAIVSLGRNGWRGTTALYNNVHSNVPNSGIPRRADEHGIFNWDWAPTDGVKYEIYSSGYDSKSVTLVAKADTHRIVLTSPMKISGSVVDAETGDPIEDFQVMPVKAFRSDYYSTDFQDSRVAKGKNGRFEIRINSQGDSTDRYRVRIEADGYRTAFGSQSVAAGEAPLEENFQLEACKPIVGEVVNENGTPAQNFHVVIGAATTSPSFDFERPDTAFGQAFEVNGDSEFSIAASFEPQRLRVFNDDGFAELLVRQEQENIGRVVLRPYANLSGRLMQGEVPIGNEGIYFHPLVQRGLTEARFQDGFFTQTDSKGNFDFGRLPPMAGRVHAYLGPWRDSSLKSSQSIPVRLRPGDHKSVVLSGSDVRVEGRIVASGRSNDEFSKRWSLNWLVSREPGVPLPSDATPVSIPIDAGRLESAWLKRTDFSNWLATKENHFVKLRDDGYLVIHGVPEGEYDLVIQLYEQPAGCLVEAVGTCVVPVTVSKDHVDSGRLDLNEIRVECRAGPRPGSDMRAFQVVNSEGQVVYLDAFEGRHVLMHVWASWCAPCLASMPQLKSDIADLAHVPLTAIGINLDTDKRRGQSIGENLNLDWSQNYVGEDSNLARQLAVSSVPAYYLIGPDGKLIASSSEWAEIKKLLVTIEK